MISAPLIAALAALPHEDPTPLDFARDVRPIFASHCLKCHGPDDQARKAGLRLDQREGWTTPLKSGAPAVVPGAPERSRLLERVTATDARHRMPPPKVDAGLSEREVAVLRRWIQEGAQWSDHWAFVPLVPPVPPVAPAPPEVSNPGWCRQPMDRLVLFRLEQEGLAPTPEDPAALPRRVSLDLLGLPPSAAALAVYSQSGYEALVDHLLQSPRFGEKWARWWLDLARYADTKGYEKDASRPMWPYRDWVVRALDADMPMDRFALEQLAGDLLPEPTRDQLIATAFHRNTMTNDEGGTDDEEFRVAAVIDRVNTTWEIWQGLTLGCAQCHTHKFDPIQHTDYYRVFALFNNTEDADRPDDAPRLRVATAEQELELAALKVRMDAEEARLDAVLAGVDQAVFTAVPPAPAQPDAPAGEPTDVPWVDDLLPTGAQARSEGLPGPFGWTDTGTPAPSSGVRCFGGRGKGAVQVLFEGADPPLRPGTGDRLFAYVWLDPEAPPKEVMLQWFTAQDGWEHRAYWGANVIDFGRRDGVARHRGGELPETGRWVRLEVAAESVGLVDQDITGQAFTQHGGRVLWDRAGIHTARPPDLRHRASFSRWIELLRSGPKPRVPEDLAALARKDTAAWSEAERSRLRRHWLRHVHVDTAQRLIPHEQSLDRLRKEQRRIEGQVVELPVMRELRGPGRRVTHRLTRGSFLDPAEAVAPGVPARFAQVTPHMPQDRRELAQWLFARDNPLTARVLANRIWEQLFGAGLVESLQDLGTQGSPPANQPLLDHLALRLRDEGWSLKRFLRGLVTSATYRQGSRVTPELLSRDPANRLLARGARFRLDGEVIRDQALQVSGLLSEKRFGPPVFPPQPDGLWTIIYSSEKWTPSTGEDRHRRGLYTFWRRTVPYPAMTTFDAPSREVCTSRRIRTNTPLQAFVTLNDPAFVEAAQALARRVVRETQDASDEAKVRHAFGLVLQRPPADTERTRVLRLLQQERAHFAQDTAAAAKLAGQAAGPAPAELAAWTVVCNVLLNLDELLTRE